MENADRWRWAAEEVHVELGNARATELDVTTRHALVVLGFGATANLLNDHLCGSLGLAFGIGVCILASLVPLPDFVPHPIVSVISVVASVLTLSAITLTAGMYPAQRAAEMTPVESLRYE